MVKYIGDIHLSLMPTRQKIVLKDVLYVPEFEVNLISQGQLVEKGVTIHTDRKGSTLYYKDKVLAYGYKQGPMTLLYSEIEVAYTSTTAPDWHARMAHIGQNALKALPKATEGCDQLANQLVTHDSKDCEICIQAKATSIIYRDRPEKTLQYLDKVHSDLCGPITPQTWSKKRYIISFIDDHTRYAEIALLATKDEAYNSYKEWVTRAERQSGLKIRRFHSDNAKEYTSKDFQALHKDMGVLGTYSSPYTPAQNGISEIFNRTILGKARSMLFQAKLDNRWWGEAVNAALYLYNRTPHSFLSYKTPYEALYQKKPDISNIKIWGSIAYRKMPLIGLKKLDPRADRYILIGYGHHQYKLANPATKRAIWVRDAYILEGKSLKTPIPDGDTETQMVSNLRLETNESNQLVETTDQLVETTDQLANVTDQPVRELNQLVNKLAPTRDNIDTLNILPELSSNTSISEFIKQLKEYAEDAMEIAMPTLAGPASYKAAIKSLEANNWLKAMSAEIEELKRQKTWNIAQLPPGRKAIPGRWVLAIKETPDGPIYKARWVAKGFRQQPGVDYTETYANTVNPVVYRLILAWATYKDWEIHQWDVKSAFPNANISEEIYVDQPTGFEEKPTGHITGKLVCKLNKALYGLKQSAREWEKHLSSLLGRMGITPLKLDQSVYIGNMGVPIILIAHVDDILALSPKLERIRDIYTQLNQQVALKDLGEAKVFLGIELYRNRLKRTLQMHQKSYIEKILGKYRPGIKYKAQETPGVLGAKLEPYDQLQAPEIVNQYQQEIGAILYLSTKTRPDIAYTTGLLSRFMANPGPEHFKALEKLWKYLAATPTYGLNYHSEPEPTGYVDSDWGGDIGTRRSTTGYFWLYRGAPISWYSKLQKTTALSSCEAEYMALKEAIKDQHYINNVSEEIPYIMGDICLKRLYTDSQSALELAKNPGHHFRTKHIDIQYHYVRENIQNKYSQLAYINTANQLADCLTKTIPPANWPKIIKQLNIDYEQKRPPDSGL